jgi:hypothetical protein
MIRFCTQPNNLLHPNVTRKVKSERPVGLEFVTDKKKNSRRRSLLSIKLLKLFNQTLKNWTNGEILDPTIEYEWNSRVVTSL